MALWNGLGQAATLAQLAGVDVGGPISMIIDAVQTVRQNKKECRQLVQDVMLITVLMQQLQQLQMMRFPKIREPLHEFEVILQQVYELVTSCQQRNIMYSFFMAGNQAQKFREVRKRIKFYLQLYPLISHIHNTYLLCGLYNRVNPSGTQPQALKELLESFASHPDARSCVNSEITMSATGSEVPCAPLSGITEFTLSTLVATTQHFPKESITGGGGHSQVTMQKIVIKVQLSSDKNRLRAMTLTAKASGVSSVWITGDGRDMLEVVGCGVDAVCLVAALRRKVGCGEILKVEEVIDPDSQPVVVNTEEAQPTDKLANRRRRARSRGRFRGILIKLSKFMWPRARRSSVSPPPPPSPLLVEHTDNPAPAASGGPSSHLFSVPTMSTAVIAAPPPACTQEQLARNPSASAAQRQDLSRAADDLPPVRVAPARRGRRTFNVSSRVRVSARPAAARRHQTAQQQAQGNVSSSNAGGTDRDELAAVEAGCVPDEYVAMFDGPMPPAVIAALAVAMFVAWVVLWFGWVC